jgi:aldose 1-epimerase
MNVKPFGVLPDGRQTHLYTITGGGLEAAITDFGAILVSLMVPDREGNMADVVLGFDEAAPYGVSGACLGATVGRNANRIGGAAFTLNGKTYTMAKNDNANNCHSGPDSYNYRLWDVFSHTESALCLTLESPNGDQGFPGRAKIRVTYTLEHPGTLRITYDGISDEDTVFNMTNHSYFNLAGNAGGSALGQTLHLYASAFTPLGEGKIPTGEIRPVGGTAFDFTTAKPIGRDIENGDSQLILGGGYDHNFVIDGYKGNGKLLPAAWAQDPASGRTMTVYTTMPGVQLYTANYTDIENGKNGAHYRPRGAFCLETQFFPDNLHHDNFVHSVFGGDTELTSATFFRFSAEQYSVLERKANAGKSDAPKGDARNGDAQNGDARDLKDSDASEGKARDSKNPVSGPEVRKPGRPSAAAALSAEKKTEKSKAATYRDKILRHKKRRYRRTIVSVVIVMALLVSLVILWMRRGYTSAELIRISAIASDDTASYANLGGNVVQYGSRGAVCIDQRGNTLWDVSYEMQQPIVSVSGEVIAIANRSGYNVYVMNTLGLMGTIRTTLPIHSIAAAENGEVAVTMDDTSTTWVRLYASDGREIAYLIRTMEENGYPLAAAVSPDGETLCLSSVSMANAAVKTNISFYNFGSAGQKTDDHLVQHSDFIDEVIPFLHYFDNTTCVCVSDKQLFCFWTTIFRSSGSTYVQLPDNVLGVFCGDSFVGILSTNTKGDTQYRLDLYNKRGKHSGSVNFTMQYTDIDIAGDKIYIHNDQECQIFTAGGRCLFKGKFEKPVYAVIPGARLSDLLVVTDGEVDSVRLH